MVHDYVEGFYLKAHALFRQLEQDGATRTRELSAAIDRIRREWESVRVIRVEDGLDKQISVASSVRIYSEVYLGRLSPKEVVVELYVGQVDMNGELRDAQPVNSSEGEAMEGVYRYAVDTSISCSGLHGFTVRVRPHHPDMPVTFIPGLITWAEAAKVAEPAVV